MVAFKVSSVVALSGSDWLSISLAVVDVREVD